LLLGERCPGGVVLVVYRNTRPGKVDPDTSRRYGEIGQGGRAQLDADRMWWNVAPARQARLKGMVFVVNGTVARIRAVDPDGDPWHRSQITSCSVPSANPRPHSPKTPGCQAPRHRRRRHDRPVTCVRFYRLVTSPP